MGTASYAYNEDRMLEGIKAFREEQKRLEISDSPSVVSVSRKEGCRMHGTERLRRRLRYNRKFYYICGICQAACARRNYAKNSEAIKAQKREYYRKLREAA